MNKIKIEFPLISHIEKTDNKVAANKFTKISGNAIYSQSLGRFQRAIVVKNLHDYIMGYLKPYQNFNITKMRKITYKYYLVKNYGSISYRSGKICWKPTTKTYVINWDLPNLHSVWEKVGNDALVINKVIIDDNASVINTVEYSWIEVDNITEQKIEIIIEY